MLVLAEWDQCAGEDILKTELLQPNLLPQFISCINDGILFQFMFWLWKVHVLHVCRFIRGIFITKSVDKTGGHCPKLKSQKAITDFVPWYRRSYQVKYSYLLHSVVVVFNSCVIDGGEEENLAFIHKQY